jgi:hypothetical protein
MSDGSVLLNAYGCGFYRVTQIDSDAPRLEYTIEVPSSADLGGCGIPVVAGDYWMMTVGAAFMLVTLDISDPSQPREVSRLPTEDGFAPHWLAKDPGSNRLIVGAENEIGRSRGFLESVFVGLRGRTGKRGRRWGTRLCFDRDLTDGRDSQPKKRSLRQVRPESSPSWPRVAASHDSK